MATLQAIRDGIANVIKGQIPSLHVYDTVPDATNFPAVIVQPDPKKSADLQGAFARGMDTWHVLIYVLVPRGTDVRAAQEKLDRFITGGGDRSVREALWNRPDLGLAETDLNAVGVEAYGGSFDTANTPCLGAILRTEVRTSGRA